MGFSSSFYNSAGKQKNNYIRDRNATLRSFQRIVKIPLKTFMLLFYIYYINLFYYIYCLNLFYYIYCLNLFYYIVSNGHYYTMTCIKKM